MLVKLNTCSWIRHTLWAGMTICALLCICAERSSAMEFVHPGVVFSKQQLDAIKTGYEQGKDPWKGWHDSLTRYRYNTAHGPHEVVSRAPNVNLNDWRADMRAIFALAMLWYLEQDVDPMAARDAADRGISLLEAWATTQKVGGGNEFGFELGDYVAVIIGAEVLKSTYPGWTATNTVHAKAYLGDFFWRYTGIGSSYNGPTAGIDFRLWRRGAGNLMSPANQGMLGMKQAMASAIFCDDEVRFREAVNAYMTSPDCALMDVAPNGQVGDTGRDWGHAGSQMESLMTTAEMMWCQGLDPYSAYNNRLRGAVEYFAHRQLYGFVITNQYGVTQNEIPSEPDFINFFPPYPTGWYWTELPGHGGDVRFPDQIQLVREIYKARGLAMPYADRYAQALNIKSETQLRRMDVSPAKLASVKVPPMWQEPTTTSQITKPDDLTIVHLGSNNGSGSVDAQGTWTLQNAVDGNMRDGIQFAYRTITGDCTFIAKVTSGEGFLLITDRLSLDRGIVHSRVEVRSGAIFSAWTFADPAKNAKNLGFYGPTVASPYWLKLVRRGNYVIHYVSVDGVNWACPANALYEDGRLQDTMYIGIANDRAAPATYTNVSIGGTGSSSLPQSPQTIQAVPQSASSVLVTWTPSPSGDACVFYDVLRYDDKGNQYWLATDLTGTSFVDSSVSSGKAFTYRIAANGFAGRNISRSPQAIAGMPPENLTATSANGSVALNWSAPSHATSYNVKRANASGGPYTTIATTTDTTYTDTGLSNGATYYYVVSCITNDFEGINSAEAIGLPANATGVWAANPQSGSWNVDGNWVGGAIPGDGLDLTFNTSTITTLTNDRAYFAPGNILFSPSANTFTISGNPWLFNGILLNTSAQRQIFSTPINLVGDSLVNAYAGDIALSGAITGNYKLSKMGTRGLLLNAANTFTGGTIIKVGSVNVGNNQSLGSGPVTLDGGILGNMAEVIISNPIAVPSSGAIALGSSFNTILASPLTGAGSLTLGGKNNGVSSNRSLYLAGKADNFSGSITVAPSDTYVRFANPTAGSASATWVFNGWNNHTTLDFSSGTIVFGAFTGSGQISTTGPGSRIIAIGAKGSNDTFSGVIADGSGTVSVTKTGTGTQTFSGAHTYSGTTSVNGGTLCITGSLAGPVTVASGGQLAGSGTIAGMVSVGTDGIVSPGAGSSIATLTLANGLTLAQNSVLNFGMGDGTDLIALSGGTYTPPATGTVRVNVIGIDFCEAGSYAIMTGATGIALNQYTLGTVPTGYKAALSVADNNLMLTLSAPVAPTDLAGTPVNSTVSLQWNASDSSAKSYTIYRADTPTSTFTALGTSSSLTYIDTTATLRLPYTYAVSASNKSGEGPLSNSVTITPTQSALWKSTAETGTWNTGANWVSDAIPANGQTVIFGPSTITATLTNNCTPGLSLSRIAFVSDAAAYTMSGNALTLTDSLLGYSTANQILDIPMTLFGTCTADINSGSVTLANVLSGTGSLRKTGNAILIVKGANTFTGNTTIRTGALYVEGTSALSTGTIILDGGRLVGGKDATIANPITVASSGAITLGSLFNFSITSSLNGSGFINFGGIEDGSFRRSLYLRGSGANFTGTATITPSDASVRIANAAMGSANATWIFNNYTWIPVSLECQPPATISFGSFRGNGFITSGGATGTITMSVGAKGLDDVYSGIISNNGTTLALTKVGSGSLLLSAPSTYSGPTRVVGGNLIMTGSVLNTASVTVVSGATLSGTGILGGTTSLQSGGIIAPGTSETNGTLTLKGLALSPDSTLEFTLGTTSDALVAGDTYVEPTGGTATITVTLSSGATVGSHTLISHAPGISASQFVLGTLPRGYTGTLSAANGNLALDLALITIPSGLVATAGNEHVSLAWSPVSGALSYTVRRAASDGVFTVLADQLSSPAYVDTSGVIDTTYTYTVSATTAAGESLDSNPASAAPYGIPIPTGLVATPGDGRVDLAWSEATGAVNYQVYRSTTSGSGYTVLASNVTTATFTDTTCTNDITYFYAVSAVTAHGEGVRSSEVSAMPKATVVIAVPTDLTAKAGDAQVKLTWSATANATGYTVWRATVSGGPYAVLGNTSDATLTDTTCVNGTTYYYAVSAVFSVGAGPRSAEVSATSVAPITFPSPTNLSATASDGQVHMTWLETVGATNYTVWRSTTQGGPYVQLASLVPNAFFTDSTCRNGLTYFYVVSAVYAAGESLYSSEISASPLAIPSSVVATAGDARVDVTWSAVSYLTGYTVLRATALDGPYVTLATEILATTFSDITCQNGTTYYYAVSVVSGPRSTGVPATPIAVFRAAPTGVTAVAGDAHVDLTWSAVDGAIGYTVARSTTSGGSYSVIGENITATTFTDTTCKNGTTYYYVISTAGSGNGDYSDEVSATPYTLTMQPSSPACGFGGLGAALLVLTLLLRQRLRS